MREADGPAVVFEPAMSEEREDPLPDAGAGKRARAGARSNTGEVEPTPEDREVSAPVTGPREGTALRTGAAFAAELGLRSGAGAL